MADPQVVLLPDTVFRVGRGDDPLQMAKIRPDDAVLPSAGNRYDVAGGGVLYASSSRAACFGETLGRFRVTPKMRAALEDEEHYMRPGAVPQDWRRRRLMVEISASAPLPFLDVDHPETQAFLSEELAAEFVALGYEDNLDLGSIRNMDRRLSRAVALWAYSATEGDGFAYSGIAYRSRLCDDWQNWAIFDGTELYQTSESAIEVSDPDLAAVAMMWELIIH